MQTVKMQSPQGEIREVRATSEELSPLMAAGWVQAPPAPAKAKPEAKKEK